MRASEDPELLHRLVDDGIAFEICPASNVSLGVFSDPASLPLRSFVDAGATVALSADDPLLFRSRLVDQYVTVRDVHGFSAGQIADLARDSITASRASDASKRKWLTKVGDWEDEGAAL